VDGYLHCEESVRIPAPSVTKVSICGQSNKDMVLGIPWDTIIIR